MPERIARKWRRYVAERARGCCEYCRSQERFAPTSFSVEHITPRQSGGTSIESNLAFSCQECNNRKYTRSTALDPINQENVPLFHPRQHHWEEHFTWSDDFARIVGITPTGRATVEALQLNRAGLVNLRLVLRTAGYHPIALPN